MENWALYLRFTPVNISIGIKLLQNQDRQEDVEMSARIRDKFRKFIRIQYQVRPNEQARIDTIYSQFFSLLTKRPTGSGILTAGKLRYREWAM